ncbi:unnamed protein product [Psylliodes chrysocephalus]|uniref:Uncharacterized protein n=1 Tax=Psylliodes chrysocephalus TaxID=3402493 RepID=A0A9P0CU43_9CUCU|nr:unnamed protein product [Psylliodes chrysocephala]
MPIKVDCRADDGDKHQFDINFLLYHKGKLYSAADDGKVMVWGPDLKKLAEVQSNPCSVFCLAGSDSTIYSCSNEGTVKAFELDTLKEKGVIAEDKQTEFWRVSHDNDCLYTGDHVGNVRVYKNDKFYGTLCISEPVKDMVIYKNLMFTANMDIIVTDLHLASSTLQFGTKNTFPGRAPITLIGDKYIAFSTSEAMGIVVHENDDSSHFKAVTANQGAHEKVINALAGAYWKDQHILFSGGWDKIIKKWKIDNGKLILDSSCETDIVINAITAGEQGDIYVGGSDGHIIRIRAD